MNVFIRKLILFIIIPFLSIIQSGLLGQASFFSSQHEAITNADFVTVQSPIAVPILSPQEAEKINDIALREYRKHQYKIIFQNISFFIPLIPLFLWFILIRPSVNFSLKKNNSFYDFTLIIIIKHGWIFNMTKGFLFSLYQKHSNLILYCIIGCSGAGLDFILYTLLTSYADIHYQTANILSCSCGIINNFILNYFFNFKTRSYFWLRMLSFYCVGLTGLGISSLLLYLLVDCMDINIIASKLTTIVLVVIFQYSFNKYISFRKGNL